MSRYQFDSEVEFSKDELELNKQAFHSFLELKDIFLDKGFSIFDNELHLFNNNEVFDEYEKRIIINYDLSKGNSIDKYTLQLEGASRKVRHFFANLVYFYLLPIAEMHSETKIDELLIYLNEDLELDFLEKIVPVSGFANYGNLKRFKYENINFIYFFVKEYLNDSKNTNELITNLDSSQLIRDLTNINVDNIQSLASRHMLNYLFNPDFYEPIVDTTTKKKIVKKFLGKVNINNLDNDLYLIRKNGFGFEKSLFSSLWTENNSDKRAILISSNIIDTNNNFNSLSLTRQDNYDNIDDLLDLEKKKILNGQKSEELVFKNLISLLDLKRKSKLTNMLSEEFDLDIETLQQKIDTFLHYSKNINIYAPFDIITINDNNEITFVEVKSTTKNKIYFSKNELLFAAENIENYLVQVVKNGEIYSIDLKNKILEINEFLMNNIYEWSFDKVEMKIEFLKEE